jgi:hypothetical protein
MPKELGMVKVKKRDALDAVETNVDAVESTLNGDVVAAGDDESDELVPEGAHVAALQSSEALVWAQRSTDGRFTQRPQKVQIRPRFTQHGGGTRTAVQGQSVR